jgi:hypothetical protein
MSGGKRHETVHYLPHALVPGREIDGAALRSVADVGDYETTGAQLKGDAWICGRTTTSPPSSTA